MKPVHVLMPKREPVDGSRHKYSTMFSRVCALDHIPWPLKLEAYDLGIVFGDNSPDYKRLLAAGVPYILVEQDVYTIRNKGADPAREKEMIENAACVLFTSEDHLEILSGRYKMPPARVVHLRPLAQDLDFEPLPKLPGQNIVYAGGIVTWESRGGLFGYRAYHEVFKRLMECGWTVHVYPAWKGSERQPDYAAIGCVTHGHVSQGDIYREMSQYQAAFHGYAKFADQHYCYVCRPNKLWEGLGAGIPIFGYNGGPAAAIYHGKWGYHTTSLRMFGSVSEKILDLKILQSVRLREVIDGDLEEFRELVEIAMQAPRKAPPVVPPVKKGSGQLRYPIRIAHDCELAGKRYPKGKLIDHETALALRATGQLKDERIR